MLTYIMPPLLHFQIVTRRLLWDDEESPVRAIFRDDCISPVLQSVWDGLYLSLGLLFCSLSTSQSGYAIYSQLVEPGQGDSCNNNI